jgi:hypothetical protein
MIEIFSTVHPTRSDDGKKSDLTLSDGTTAEKSKVRRNMCVSRRCSICVSELEGVSHALLNPAMGY